jgi:hypothetical protein
VVKGGFERMNNIRQIIADKIAKLKDKRVNDYADGFNDGLFEAFKIFLEEIPAPRTEADILKDFEKLGYRVIKLSTMYLFETDEEERRIWIHTDLKEYCISIENMPLAYRTFTMQEHKLLNELFEVWQWI